LRGSAAHTGRARALTLSDFHTRVAAATGRRVVEARALGGGCIAPVYRARLDDGRELAVKLGPGLDLEARMLRDLARHAPAPEVIHVDAHMLLMTYIPTRGGIDAAAEEDLARVVAALHAVPGQRYGFAYDTVIGGLPQSNSESDDWRAFFRDRRLLAMARQALDAGRLPTQLMARVERLAGRLERWIDAPAPPAQIHGDLWGGNILAHDGRIAGLIDPALYHADPEIELAFMTLFHTVGERFFAAYGGRHQLRPGFFEARRDLYNLYPLLVHARLFGGGYIGDVARTLDRFGV
jgi:fructosamine-3-kinase